MRLDPLIIITFASGFFFTAVHALIDLSLSRERHHFLEELDVNGTLTK